MPNNQESSQVSSENKIEEIQEQSKINITYNGLYVVHTYNILI